MVHPEILLAPAGEYLFDEAWSTGTGTFMPG
jgi:hypothetical protein